MPLTSVSRNTLIIPSSGVLAGENNVVQHPGSFIIGNNITTSAANTLFVNSLSANSKLLGSAAGLQNIILTGRENFSIRGTTSNEFVGNGTSVSFYPLNGFNSTDSNNYIVSIGGLNQIPTDYTVTETAGGTITFPSAPPRGSKILVRLLVGGAAGEDAVKILGRNVSTNIPTDGQALVWSSADNEWQPQTLTGGLSSTGGETFVNTTTSFNWQVPYGIRYVRLQAVTGHGAAGTPGSDGADGAPINVTYDYIIDPSDEQQYYVPVSVSNGANGVDGIDGTEGAAGKSVIFGSTTYSGGAGGLKGYGGGGGGGASVFVTYGLSGNDGRGPNPGLGGEGFQSGGNGADGANGTNPDFIGSNAGGAGGQSESLLGASGGNGGRGGQNENSKQNGGGGGGGSGQPSQNIVIANAGTASANVVGSPGEVGKGGKGSDGYNGLNGQSLDLPYFVGSSTTIPIQITAGAGTASLRITW